MLRGAYSSLQKGTTPSFDITEQGTFAGAETIAEVPCPSCKRKFTVYSKDHVPEDELAHCKELAEKQTEQALLNHHSQSSQHPKGALITVPKKGK